MAELGREHRTTPVTREDFVRELFRYLDPLRAHYSELGARVVIGHTSAQYEDEVIPMEAWARPLWGLVPLWAGGGHDAFFEDVYRRGLVAGTDPASPEYWGGCRDHDQKFVEMAAIAYGLLLAPGVLWEPLSDEERVRVAAWLGQINEHACPDGNWLFFCVLVNVALRSLGMPFDEAMLERCLARLDDFYLGEGWYQDGPTGVADYYVPFAFHFYALLYARTEVARDPERAGRYRERARELAPQLALLFSDRGEAVPYGRSMTYRFAQAAFFSAAAAFGLGENGAGSKPDAASLMGAEAKQLSSSQLKGLVARSLGWWGEQPVFDNGGVLTIGYRYPNLHMAEGYNAPGSPFWALKAFACLALPAGDPFWELESAALPVLPELTVIARGHQLVQRAGGEVALYPDGAEPGHPFAQAAAKYSKFVYTTRFGFSVARGARTLEDAAPDSCLAFVLGAEPACGGRPARSGHVFVREGIDEARVEAGEHGPVMVSRWSPWPGIEVETRVEPIAGAAAGTHVRRHRVTSSIACEAYDCGFAVPGDYHTVDLASAERTCRVRATGVVTGEPTLIKAEANTNVTCGKTVIPAVRYEISVGVTELATEIVVQG